MNTMKLQEINAKMLEYNACHTTFLDCHNIMISLLTGVFTSTSTNKRSFTEMIHDIFAEIELIDEYYSELGLISEDGDPFDDESYKLTRIERRFAAGKIQTLEDIPEPLRAHFPTEPMEFAVWREGLRDSEAIRVDILDAGELINERLEILGEEPFCGLLSDVDSNVDKLAENLDDLFSNYIKKFIEFKNFF